MIKTITCLYGNIISEMCKVYTIKNDGVTQARRKSFFLRHQTYQQTL